MSKLEQSLCQLLEKGEDVVLATILSHAGSTPRTAGTKMLIRSDGNIIGTVGGGEMEAEVIKTGLEIFRTTDDAQIRSFDLTNAAMADSIDAICGGRLNVLTERIRATPETLLIFRNLLNALQKGEKCLLIADLEEAGKPLKQIRRCLMMNDGSVHGDLALPPALSENLKRFHRERSPALLIFENRRYLTEPAFIPGTVYLFGAGHVSQKVALLTRMTDFRTVVLDDREAFANRNRFREADEISVLDDFDHAFSDLEMDHDSYVVILTRGHSHDKTVLEQALRTQAGYIGMIGSKRKRDAIYSALLDQGFTSEDLARVHSPIGLSIRAETPEEIAVSIIAELIAFRADK